MGHQVVIETVLPCECGSTEGTFKRSQTRVAPGNFETLILTLFNLSLDIVMIFVFCKRFFPLRISRIMSCGFFCHREMTVDQEVGCY